jgi:hypothetical protein
LLTHREKRAFPRIKLECEVTYRRPGAGDIAHGICRDLSGGGISFIANDPLSVGTSVEISVVPQNTITPPLDAIIEVVRSEPAHQAGQYRIAGAIQRVLGEAT